jgi:hypothetical protein
MSWMTHAVELPPLSKKADNSAAWHGWTGSTRSRGLEHEKQVGLIAGQERELL